MDIIALLEGIISSVPEAIGLFHKIAPLIDVRADVTPEQVAVVSAIAPEVHALVEDAHKALTLLFDAHKLTSI